jgi:hypothetical protein
MSGRGRLFGLVLMALLWAGPAQSQDIFGTLLSIMNEETGTGSGKPIIIQPAPDGELLQIQRQLATLGYDVGVPDGVMGPRTQRAIASYQLCQGLGRGPGPGAAGRHDWRWEGHGAGPRHRVLEGE